jgi:ABC-type transport system substrate-binding protein
VASEEYTIPRLQLLIQAFENIIADPASIDPSSQLSINLDYLRDWQQYIYLIRNKQLPIFTVGWSPDYADPHNYIETIVRSTGRYASRVGLAGSIGKSGVVWDHETVDGWIDAAAAELNPAARISLYAQIQEGIVEQCAYLWCYQGVEFHVERYEMNGYVYNPMRQPYFFHYYKSTATTPIGFLNIPIGVLIASAVVIGIVTVVILKKSSQS